MLDQPRLAQDTVHPGNRRAVDHNFYRVLRDRAGPYFV